MAGLAIFKSLHSCHIDMCTDSFYMFMLYSRYTSLLVYHGGVLPLIVKSVRPHSRLFSFFLQVDPLAACEEFKKTSNKDHQRDYTVQSEFHENIVL